MILKKMTAKDAMTSKAMLAGILLICLGVYLIIKGEFDKGMLSVGNGLGIMGIRDAI